MTLKRVHMINLRFYTLILLVTFGMTSVTMFYYTNVMKGLFQDYKEVTTVTKFWDVSRKL